MERRRTAIVLSPAIRKESRGTGSPAGADAGFRVRGGASGVSRISARGVLKVRPHTKSGGGGGGGGQFASGPIRKVGGGGGGGGGDNSLQVQYEKWWGGGANSLQVRYEKWGGGGGGTIPLQVRYLCLAHREYLHVPTYVLPRYTSHARANELKIHAGKG